MGAARPTVVQSGGVGVFERSDDHAEVSVRSLHAQRGGSASLISHFPLGPRALGERSTPERSDEVRSEA